MKGSRAKKAAEAEAGADGAAAEMEPTPPSAPREGGPRPGPVVQSSAAIMQIPEEEFKKLIEKLRSTEKDERLLGPEAADAFEAAAGLRPVATPQSKSAKELRSEVADSRDADEEKGKKAMKFDAAPVEDIPDLPEERPKHRASVSESDALDHEVDLMNSHCKKDAEEPPELNLTTKQNSMRTDLELWVMDEIPPLYGVDDSEELDESLQEDNQADQVTFLIAETEEEKQGALLEKWLSAGDCASADAKADFTEKLLGKVRDIQAIGPKKKKKKKKADA